MSTIQYDSNGNIINTQDESLEQIIDSQGNIINPAKEDGNLASIETKVLTDSQLRASPVPVSGLVSVSGVATESTLQSVLTELQQKTEPTDTQLVSVNNFPAVQPVSDNGGSLTVDGSVSISGTPTVVLDASSLTALENITVQNGSGASAVNIQDGGNSITVDGSVTATISGTPNVNVTNSSIGVSSVDLDIRSLIFATDKVDTSGSSVSVNNFPSVQPIDDNGSSITVDGTVELGATSLAALENITATVSGPVDLSTATLTALENITVQNGAGASAVNIQDGGNSITVDGSVTATISGTPNVAVTSSVLPTGAATATLQTTGNTSLSSIDTKTPSLGQAVMASSSPVVIASDQSNLNVNIFDGSGSALPSDTAIPSELSRGLLVRVIDQKKPTFTVSLAGISTALNKTMLGLYNSGSSIVRIKRVFLVNDRDTAVTGVRCDFNFSRHLTLSGGTAVVPVPHDTTKTLPLGISCSTNSTRTGTELSYRQITWSTDEWSVGTLDQEGYDKGVQYSTPFHQTPEDEDDIVIRPNQAVSLICSTNTTTGIFQVRIIFTTE